MKSSPWKNSIVGHAEVAPGELVANDRNFREHPRAQKAALAGAIEEIGFLRSLTVNQRSGCIIDGHLRLELALEKGEATIPVEYVDLSEEEEAVALATIDPIAAMATTNKQALEALLKDAQVRDSSLRDMLADLAQQNGLVLAGLNAHPNGLTDPDAVPEPPDEPTTQPGDLWILGHHRLLCGDSAKAEDVDRLLDGQAIHLVHSDPPYGVRVEPRSHNAIAAGLSSFEATHNGLDTDLSGPRKLRARDRPLQNDFVSEAEFNRLLDAWFGNLARVLLPGHSFVLWGGYSNLENYPPVLKKHGLYFSQGIVWDKEHPVLSRKDLMGAFELAFYGWKEGAAHRFFGPHNATDLWHIKKVAPQNMVHLTEKPVALAERALQYFSLPDEHVLDLFGGSGSTLIAAERTGRKAFLMEIDGLYCDLMVRRWQEFTGRTALRHTQGD
jgi:DNA modification methylase